MKNAFDANYGSPWDQINTIQADRDTLHLTIKRLYHRITKTQAERDELKAELKAPIWVICIPDSRVIGDIVGEAGYFRDEKSALAWIEKNQEEFVDHYAKELVLK